MNETEESRQFQAVLKSGSNRQLIWQFFRGFRLRTFFTLLFLTLSQLAGTADPIYLKKIIDAIGARGAWATVAQFLVVYFTLRAVGVFFDFLRDVIFSKVEMGLSKKVSEVVFDHLLRLPMAFHSEQKTGALAKKITRGSSSIQFILDFLVINILPTVFALIFVTALLLRNYPPAYGLITAGTVIFYTIFTVWTTEYRQRYRLQANLADDEASATQVDTLTNIETVKYFHNEATQEQKYKKTIGKWYSLSISSNNLFAAISSGQGIIILVGLGSIFFLAVKQAVAGQLSTGDLVLLTTYITRLASPIGVLGFVYRRIKDGIADLDEMAKILRQQSTMPEPAEPKSLTAPRGEVTFDHVSFAYAGRHNSLSDVGFAIRPGQRVAIVGPSGAGKSTIVKLLFRFYDPTGGQILIDGVPLRELSYEARRAQMTIVPQEPVLFNDTIAENIRFGKPGASSDEIRHAAKLAHIDTFIDSLPEGYKTVVGDRGIKLSGGEKQRVAIARAIIRDPKILVFDEATSSLDTKSERAIQEALDQVARGRTTIAIAHRLSTIVNSDRIYVLEHGKVAEAGTHDELLRKHGLYARLWQLQSEAEPEKQSVVAPGLA